MHLSIKVLAGVLVAALAGACGGSGKSAPPKATPKTTPTPLAGGAPGPGRQYRFNFTLANNGPVAGLKAANLTLRALAFRTEEGLNRPVPMPANALPLDLLSPAPVPLAVQERLPGDRYVAVVLSFDPEASVTCADGSVRPLRLGPELATLGLALTPPFQPAGPGPQDLWLVLDLLTALAPAQPGPGIPHLLPTFAICADRGLTGQVQGRILDRDAGTPLAGVRVSAQPVPPDPLRLPRQTVSDAQGRFTLDLLAPGPVWVTAQPALPDGRTYEAVAVAAEVPLGASGPQGGVTLACAPCPAPGEVLGALPGPLGPERRVLVELLRDPETGPGPFVVRRTLLQEGDSGYRFQQVPPGRYRLRVRPILNPGSRTWTAGDSGPGKPFQVTAAPHREDLPA